MIGGARYRPQNEACYWSYREALAKSPSIEKGLFSGSRLRPKCSRVCPLDFSEKRAIFLRSFAWVIEKKVAANSETNESPRTAEAEKTESPKMAPNNVDKPTIAGLPPLLAWPPLLFPWAPLLPGAWCSTALRNAFPGYVCFFARFLPLLSVSSSSTNNSA